MILLLAVIIAAAFSVIRKVKSRDRKSAVRLQNAFRTVERKRCSAEEKSKAGERLRGSEEWLADNFYLAEQLKNSVYAFLDTAFGGKRRAAAARRTSALCREVLESLDWKIEEESLFVRLISCCADLEEDGIGMLESWFGFHLLLRLAAVCEWKHEDGAKQMAACISSIRTLGNLNWGRIQEAVSPVEKILLEDPANVYRNMDQRSKAYYRACVGRIAARRRISETEAAQEAVRLAQSGTAKSFKERHVGFYLCGEGSCLPEGRRRAGKASATRAKCYVAVICALTLLMCAETVCVLVLAGAPAGWCAVLGALSVIPMSAAAVRIVQWLMMRFTRTKPIPALALSRIPAEGSAFVAVPALLTSPGQTQKMLDKLETLYHAGQADNLYFAILGDLKDADCEEKDEDSAITQTALEGIERLNRIYGGRFYYFGRRRSCDSRNKRYLGWERKRGALAEFVRLLHGERTSYAVMSETPEKLPKVTYIITLDADTEFLKDSAQKLIGAMLHPLNQPEIDEESGVVAAGFGLLQPRIQVAMGDAEQTAFSRIFAGRGGIDAYSSASPDFYQDIFGTGIFTGKGIFDVEAYWRVLSRAIPEQSVLSHDLLEGGFLRAGFLSGCVLEDGYPARFLAHIKRLHRWTRGDWQLLPYLSGTIRTENGEKRKNGLSFLTRFQIFDNLRRSMEWPAALILILVGLAAPGCVGAAALIAAVWFLVAEVIQSTVGEALSGAFLLPDGRREAERTLKQSAATAALLPYLSFQMLDAAARACVRTFITKKNMLEWVTAAETERSPEASVAGHYRRMGAQIVCGAAAVILAAAGGGLWQLGVILAAVWCIAPYFAQYIGRAHGTKRELDKKERELLLRIAKKTWKYFDDFCGEEDNFLPPDNFQKQPYHGLAHRTSPTNIGMLLGAYAAAYDFGWLSASEMAARMDATLTTVERMEKTCGHLYNWYDTQTLAPLQPRFVSTVDNGNFACLLIAAKQALLETGVDPGLCARIDALLAAMDFRFLYDPAKELFSIGYDAQEHQLVDSYYDLLASEARQAGFLAVVRGEIPEANWYRMGRRMVRGGNGHALVSWTGTMFEYLMPPLLMPSHEQSLLGRTYRNVVREQKRYAKRFGLPVWGISECAFGVFDRELNYQYKALGVPRLSLKRDLHHDLVMSPYSSCLALAVNPREAAKNLQEFCRMGAEGEYGMYEAVDFTNGHIGKDHAFRLVKCYMAHHQGMSLLAIDNALCGGAFCKRFMREPAVRMGKYLLDEQVPVRPAVICHSAAEERQPMRQETGEIRLYEKSMRLPQKPDSYFAVTNGEAQLFFSSRGTGAFRVGERCINRFHPVFPDREGGHFVFVKPSHGEAWESITQSPLADSGPCRADFFDGMASFSKNCGALSCRMEVTLAAEDNVELRAVTLRNDGEACEVELMDYMEVILAGERDDRAHPAFSGLFVQTHFHEEDQILTASRRPRREGEERFCAALGVSCTEHLSFETSRENWLGRSRTADGARAFRAIALDGGCGTVLDPVLSLRIRFRLAAGEEKTVRFVTAAAKSTEKAKSLCARWLCAEEWTQQVAGLRERMEEEMRVLALREGEEALFYEIMSALMRPEKPEKTCADKLLANREGQLGLWKFGISGDWPMILCRADAEGTCIEQMARLAVFLRLFQMRTECVIVQEGADGYYNEPEVRLSEELVRLGASHLKNARGGLFLLDSAALTESEQLLLRAAAALELDGGRPFAEQLAIQEDLSERETISPHAQDDSEAGEAGKDSGKELEFFNGYGGYDGADYVIRLSGGRSTPLPWSHIVANERFGFLATERGGGYVWAGNSREMKLTPWSNDAQSDPPGELFWIRGADGRWYSPLKGLMDDGGLYIIRYGFGFCRYSHRAEEIQMDLEQSVPESDPCKLSQLTLTNLTNEPQDYSVYYAARIVLGADARAGIVSWEKDGALYAQNSYPQEDAGRVVVLSADVPFTSFTGDAAEFFGQDGALLAPRDPELNGRMGMNPTACLAGCVTIRLEPGEARRVCFLLGSGNAEEEAAHLAAKYRAEDSAAQAIQNSRRMWAQRVGQISVKTPNLAFDKLINGWLIYQAWACRLFAKSAFYQCGGATGFRDQLQDSLALLYCAPERTRKQILYHAAHQFPEGDVQHWWHDRADGVSRGIRTRMSDDLLWLPYAVCEYVRVTGDSRILREEAPYLEGEPLADGEQERYAEAGRSTLSERLYCHTQRALRRAMTKGTHGLPLMGGGDWNDGMNTVGSGGAGESVWLGWFLADILKRFIPVSQECGDDAFVKEMEQYLQELIPSLDQQAWDGEWFLRAYFDDGTPLGTKGGAECRIDSISQSWAVLSGAGKEEKTKSALAALRRHLVDDENGLIRLLSPAFDKMEPSPGYIRGYLPGVRENGGQYTHAAVWAVMAFARAGKPGEALRLLDMLSPIRHSETQEEAERYRTEPYVLAADVYTAYGAAGRGGWSWYTGAAGWMFRAAVEEILGMKKKGDEIWFEPRTGDEWAGFELNYRFGKSLYRFHFKHAGSSGRRTRTRLVDDGKEHDIFIDYE